jgi:hypothetical protein
VSTTDWDAEFAKIKEETPEFYPGSTKAIVRHPNRVEAPRRRGTGVDPDWDAKPRIYPTEDGPTEFFTLGQLAKALGRQSVTIRKWEREGIIPKALYQVPGRNNSPHGRRRLYTRRQVEGMVRIAEEEGLLADSKKAFAETRFSERVLDLFKATA